MTKKEASLDEALEVANKWLINDPDETTKVETENLISRGDIEFIQRFSNSLVFGTAGIRGARGAGPMRKIAIVTDVICASLSPL